MSSTVPRRRADEIGVAAGPPDPVAAPTAVLAEFASSLDADRIDEAVRERTKDLLLDALASGFAGHDAPESQQVLRAAARIMGRGSSAVIGSHPMSEAAAAVSNGYLITAVTVCDVHRPTMCHVTPAVVPALLAIAERVRATGRDLLVATAVALELTSRLAVGTDYGAFRSRGWHAPGVVGPLGGAAGAARLLRLTTIQTRNAIGIAASQAAGTWVQLGTPTIKFQQARAALSALIGATLAAEGFSAAEEVLVARDGGLLNSYSNGGLPDLIVSDLGRRWELMEISFRPWPVGMHLQTVVTALMELLPELGPDRTSAIKNIKVRMSPDAYQIHGGIEWTSRLTARLSARYVVAVVVFDQRCWLEQFSEQRIADARLSRFAHEHVQVEVDPLLSGTSVSITVELNGGRTLSSRVDTPHGDPSAPLSRQEVVAKFIQASTPLIGQADATAIVGDVAHLEEEQDVRQLIRRLAKSARAR